MPVKHSRSRVAGSQSRRDEEGSREAGWGMGGPAWAHRISRPVHGRSPGKPIESVVSRERRLCPPVGFGLPAPPIKKPEENESLNSGSGPFLVSFRFRGKEKEVLLTPGGICRGVAG